MSAILSIRYSLFALFRIRADVRLALRPRSRSQSRQFPAADAAHFPERAAAVFPERIGDRPRRSAAQLSRVPCPQPAPRERACQGGAWRAATPCPSCSPIRRRCSSATTASRCAAPCSTPSTRGSTRPHRVHARPWRGEGDDRRPRIFGRHRARRSSAPRSARSSSTTTIRNMTGRASGWANSTTRR